jgi:hypothetical protein
MTEACDGTRARTDTIHDRGIEFRFAVMGQHGTTASVELWIVFQQTNRLGDGVEARAATLEERVSRIQRCGQSRKI